MCVVLMIHYACSHHRPMPAPIVNTCEPKQTISRIRGQQARCLPEATVTWDIASNNVCPMCSGSIYRYEKRFELVRKLAAMGYADRLSPMSALDADQIRMWKIWVADRERFRQIGVRGGKDGELGQGVWSLRPWGKGGGFEEWYNFDGFLGVMGPFKRGEVKGLEALYGTLHRDEGGDGDAGEGEGDGEGVAAAREPGEGTSVSVILGLSDAELEPKVELKAEGKAEGSGQAGKKKKNKKNKKKGKGKGKEGAEEKGPAVE